MELSTHKGMPDSFLDTPHLNMKNMKNKDKEAMHVYSVIESRV